MPTQGASRRGANPVCRACKEPERPYQPLFRCVVCKRRYHAACYNPPPSDPQNWTCKKCTQPDSNKRYNETWSSTTFATQNTSASTSRPSHTQPESNMSRTGFVFSPHASDASGTMGMRCSFIGCTSLTEDGGPLCSYHMNYMISGPDKASEKLPNSLSKQPRNAKLHPENSSEANKIKMTKTAPRTSFLKPLQSTSKQTSPLTATPRLVASPNSLKAASRRRPVLSPSESTAVTGSPLNKKPRQSSGTFDLNNSAQASTFEPSSRSVNRADRLAEGLPAQNGTYQGPASLNGHNGMKNGLHNGVVANNAREPWDPTETDSWLPLRRDQSSNVNTAPNGSRTLNNGFSYSNGMNQPWDTRYGSSFLPPYPETNLFSAARGLSAANGLSQDAVRGSYTFDPLPVPRNNASIAPMPTVNLSSSTAQRINANSNTKLRPPVSKEAKGPLRADINKPPLEVQREQLAEKNAANTSSLDALIYNQEGAAEPPPGVIIPEAQPRPAKDSRFFSHIDPRVHWCRPHSKEWHEKKQAEIKERGGRKANFGKAAERMKQQRLENPVPEEESLPERVRENPEWMRAQAWFKECSQKDWEKDKEATRRAEAEVKTKAKRGGRRS